MLGVGWVKRGAPATLHRLLDAQMRPRRVSQPSRLFSGMWLMVKPGKQSEKLPNQAEEPLETIMLVILSRGLRGRLHSNRQQKH